MSLSFRFGWWGVGTQFNRGQSWGSGGEGSPRSLVRNRQTGLVLGSLAPKFVLL